MKEKVKWSNFTEFIKKANLECKWVVLRNHEFLPDNFFGNDKDVDILCEDVNIFVNKLGLYKRSWGISSYESIISGQRVSFDVRFLGDNYYDKLWQYKMLYSSFINEYGVPVLDYENFFYSLLYHVKLQKISVSRKYASILLKTSKKINLEVNDISLFYDDEMCAKILYQYFTKNNYYYNKPVDINVITNKSFYACLDKCLLHGYKPNVPLRYLVYHYMPKILFKYAPKSFKNMIKNTFYLYAR